MVADKNVQKDRGSGPSQSKPKAMRLVRGGSSAAGRSKEVERREKTKEVPTGQPATVELDSDGDNANSPPTKKSRLEETTTNTGAVTVPVQQPPRDTQPNVPQKSTGIAGTVGTGSGRSSDANSIFVRSNRYLERPNLNIPPVVLKQINAVVPPGNPGDQWVATSDIQRGESYLFDDPKAGGDLGYRSLTRVPTPADRPAGIAEVPVGQACHDWYKFSCSFLEQVEMHRFYETMYHKDGQVLRQKNEELEALAKEKQELEADKKRVEAQLENQLQCKKDLLAAQNAVTAERKENLRLKEVIKKMEEEKPLVRSRAVNRYRKSEVFRDYLVERYTTGWVAAHRCCCHELGWSKDDWDKLEASYGKNHHLIPTPYEEASFGVMLPEEVMNNADPRDMPEVEFDPSILDSPRAASDGPTETNAEAVKDWEKKDAKKGEAEETDTKQG